MYLYLLFKRSQVFWVFKYFNKEVKKLTDKVIKVVRYDRGGEYYDNFTEIRQKEELLAQFLKKEDIVPQCTMSVMPTKMV